MNFSRPISPGPVTVPDAAIVKDSQYIDPLTLPPVQEVRRLVHVFFSDTGMLFPFLYEKHILNTYEVASANHFQNLRPSWLGLMHMIFAFATCVSIGTEQSVSIRTAKAECYFHRAQVLYNKYLSKSANLETGMLKLESETRCT